MGRPPGSTQSEKPKRGDRASASRSQVAADVAEEATLRRATATAQATVGSGEHGKIAKGLGINPRHPEGLVDLCPRSGPTSKHDRIVDGYDASRLAKRAIHSAVASEPAGWRFATQIDLGAQQMELGGELVKPKKEDDDPVIRSSTPAAEHMRRHRRRRRLNRLLVRHELDAAQINSLERRRLCP